MIDKIKSLTKEAVNIIQNKGTECAFSGDLNEHKEEGTYLCRRCGLALFRSKAKFNSGTGWPSFDCEIDKTIKYEADEDGIREEILCNRCHAHLGHVFYGEGFTKKNTRHCVNSKALDFVYSQDILDTEEAIFAGGCFWGVEHLFLKLPGVIKTEVGYIGGSLENPSYEQVCRGNMGHYEGVRIIFDVDKTSFLKVAKYFFEIHDPTQSNGQGPDIGEQYKSVAFYYDQEQKNILEDLITELKKNNINAVTKILPVTTFWPAEEYHQKYYQKSNKTPYCHVYKKRF